MIGARSIDQAGGTLDCSWNHADLPNVQYFAISRRIGMRIARIVTFMAFVAPPAAQAACDWQQISPGSGKFTVNRMLVDLGEGDESVKPSSWQGPIRIARFEGTGCTVDASVGIVEPPLFAAGSILLVTTFSGSNRTVFGWRTGIYKVLWKSKPFAGRVALHGGSADARRLAPDARGGVPAAPEWLTGGRRDVT